MKLLTRYLFKEILHNLWLFLAILFVVTMVAQVYDSREDFLKYDPPMVSMAKFLLLSIPSEIAQTLPLVCLMSTIFAYGLLAKNREILAMVAAGISFRRLAVPAMIFGAGMTFFMFWFNESVVPASESAKRWVERIEIRSAGVERKQAEFAFTQRRHVIVKGEGNRLLCMQSYSSETHEMEFPTIMEMSEDGSGLTARIEAERGRLVSTADQAGEAGEAGEKKKQSWQFEGAERWLFNPDGTLRSYEKFQAPFQMELEADLSKFLSVGKKTEEMNYRELSEHIDFLRRKGDKEIPSNLIALEQKITFPIAGLLMALLGFSVVADVHARRFARGVFTGILVAIGFYILNALLHNIGKNDVLPPLAAAWLPVAVFTLVIYYLSVQIERIRG